MPQYRIYDVSRNGRFLGPSRILTSVDDEGALRLAVGQQPQSVWALEIWTGDRLVALMTINPEAHEPLPESSPTVAPVPLDRGGLQVGAFELAAAPSTEA